MSTVAYHRHCPICGAALVPNATNPYTAPWRCDVCLISWWVSELTQEARAAFRVRQEDWGTLNSASHKAVRAAVHEELARALIRGTSVRQDQLGLIPPATLTAILRQFNINPSFVTAIKAAL